MARDWISDAERAAMERARPYARVQAWAFAIAIILSFAGALAQLL